MYLGLCNHKIQVLERCQAVNLLRDHAIQIIVLKIPTDYDNFTYRFSNLGKFPIHESIEDSLLFERLRIFSRLSAPIVDGNFEI
jgi:hypothetical protein